MVKVGADLTNMQKGFNQASKNLKTVGKQFSSAGATLTKGLTVPILGAAAALTGLALKAGENADALITLANKTGIATEQLQEMQYAARFIDVEVETMTGSMQKLTKNMDNAKKGIKDQVEAFAALGVEYQNADGTLRNAKEVWADSIDALGNISNEAERDAIAMRLFGKSAQELNPLIVAGTDELTRLSEEAHNVGAVLSDEDIEAMGAFDDAMQRIKATTEAAGSKMGLAFIPVIEKIIPLIQDKLIPGIQKFADWISKMIDGFNNLSPSMQKFTLALGALVIGIGPVFSVVGKLTTGLGGIVGAAGTASKAFTLAKGGIMGVKAAFTAFMGPAGLVILAVAAVAAAAYLIIKYWEPIKSFFINLWDGIVSFFKSIPKKMISIGTDLVKGLWEGIKSAGNLIKKKITGFGSGIINKFKSIFGEHSPSTVMEEVGVNLGKGLAKGIDESVTIVQKSTSKLANLLISKQEELGKKLLEITDDAQKEAVQKQIDSLSSLHDELTSLTDEIEQKQENFASKLQSYGALFDTIQFESGDVLELRNLQPDIDELVAYGKALDDLKQKEIPEDLLTEIQDMDVATGLEYAQKLLALTDEEYDEYILKFNEKQALAKQIAEKFYAEELNALSNEFVNKLPAEFSDIKSEMESVGIDAAKGVALGFASQEEEISTSFVGTLSAALDAAKKSLDINSPSKVMHDQVGAMAAAGIAEGISDNKNLVTNAMSELTSGLSGNTNIGLSAQTSPADNNLSLTNAFLSGLNMIASKVSANNNTSSNATMVLDGITTARMLVPYVLKEFNRIGVKVVEA